MLGNVERRSFPNDLPDEELIVDKIFTAVIEQRLPPGTKLSESALCEAFGVGRMRVRRSLLLLASRNIVDLQSNRGAYVSSPTPQEAKEVFEARCSIEPNVARLAAQRSTVKDVDRLRRLLDQEKTAHNGGDRRQSIRLSGEFHVMLAEMAENLVLQRMVKELVTRTSLIIGMFGAPGTNNCHDDEHGELLDAIAQRDALLASTLMERHLSHIENRIDLTSEPRRTIDLVGLFKPAS